MRTARRLGVLLLLAACSGDTRQTGGNSGAGGQAGGGNAGTSGSAADAGGADSDAAARGDASLLDGGAASGGEVVVRKTRNITPAAVAIDAVGNVYAVGRSTSPLTKIDLGFGERTLEAGTQIIALVWSYDARGALRWLLPVRAEQVAFAFWGGGGVTLALDASSRAHVTISGSDGNDTFVLRVDADGTLGFQRQVVLHTNLVKSAVSDGRLLTCGTANSGDLGCGPLPATGRALLETSTEDGSCIRSTPWEGSAVCRSVQAVGDDVFLAGETSGSFSLGGMSLTRPDTALRNYIAQLDADRKAVWIRDFESALMGGFHAGATGDLFVAGTYSRTATELGVTTYVPGDPVETPYLARFDRSGAPLGLEALPGSHHFQPPLFSGFAGDDAYLFYEGGTDDGKPALRTVRADKQGALHDPRVFPIRYMQGEPSLLGIASNELGTAVLAGSFYGTLELGPFTIQGPTDTLFTADGFVAVIPKADPAGL